MAKRMVGRRVVEDNPQTATLVTVHRRWPWQRDDFYTEGGGESEIGVTINGNLTLTITTKDETVSYSPHDWRRVISKSVPKRSRI
jgi:hypothetical protein